MTEADPFGGMLTLAELRAQRGPWQEWTTADVARHFRLKESTVVNWRKRGYGPDWYEMIGDFEPDEDRVRYHSDIVVDWYKDELLRQQDGTASGFLDGAEPED